MFGTMKSKIEVRKFAIEQAHLSMIKGDSDKSIVEVAKEIADFVLGDAALPEYVNDEDTLTALTKIISANAIIGTNEKPSEPHTEPTSGEA